jgi:hypothetical protein
MQGAGNAVLCHCCPLGRTKPAGGRNFGLLEAQSCGAAAGLGEQSLHAAGVPGAMFSSVTLLPEELSLLACAFCYLWSKRSV